MLAKYLISIMVIFFKKKGPHFLFLFAFVPIIAHIIRAHRNILATVDYTNCGYYVAQFIL